MTIRWVVVALGFLILLPIAVFLRSANAGTVPEKTKIVIATVCKKPVAVYIIHNGYSYFATMAQIENDEDLAKRLSIMFANAEIYTSETAHAAGIGCPRIVSL